MKYAAVFAKTTTGWSAYIPDLPGRVSTGRTGDEIQRNIREAVALHLEGMRAEGLAIPEPTTWTELVQASA